MSFDRTLLRKITRQVFITCFVIASSQMSLHFAFSSDFDGYSQGIDNYADYKENNINALIYERNSSFEAYRRHLISQSSGITWDEGLDTDEAPRYPDEIWNDDFASLQKNPENSCDDAHMLALEEATRNFASHRCGLVVEGKNIDFNALIKMTHMMMKCSVNNSRLKLIKYINSTLIETSASQTRDNLEEKKDQCMRHLQVALPEFCRVGLAKDSLPHSSCRNNIAESVQSSPKPSSANADMNESWKRSERLR